MSPFEKKGILCRPCIHLRLFLAALLLLLAVFPASAQNESTPHPRGQEIKAGLLYHFLKYVDWPPGSFALSSTKIVICLYKSDPFGGYLQPLAGRSVNQREIEIRAIQGVSTLAGCNLLFVNAAQQAGWPALLKGVDGRSILTVGDFKEFTASGGMIAIDDKDTQIHICFNLNAIVAAQLHIRDPLLKLGVSVSVSPATNGGR